LKKEAKTSATRRAFYRIAKSLQNKSFLVLFFKKERLAFYGLTPFSAA